MYNNFLNSIQAMEYQTNISDNVYARTKENFDALYNAILSEYDYEPYFSVSKHMETFHNVNLYTIEIYRLGIYPLSELASEQSLRDAVNLQNEIKEELKIRTSLLPELRKGFPLMPVNSNIYNSFIKRIAGTTNRRFIDVSTEDLKQKLNELRKKIRLIKKHDFSSVYTECPKNIVKLYGFPEDAVIYQSNEKVPCVKIQLSDKDNVPSVMPVVTPKTSSVGTDVNNFIAKSVQKYINEQGIFRGNSDYSSRVNVSSTNKIKEIIIKFLFTSIAKFRVILMDNLENINFKEYPDAENKFNNEIYKFTKDIDSKDLSSLDVLGLSGDIKKLYKVFDTLLSKGVSQAQILMELDEYIDDVVENNFEISNDVRVSKSLDDLASKIQPLFVKFMRTVIDGVYAFMESKTVIFSMHSKFLNIITAGIKDEFQFTEEELENAKVSLPDAFASIDPNALSLVPSSYIKYIFDMNKAEQRREWSYNFEILKRRKKYIDTILEFMAGKAGKSTDKVINAINKGLDFRNYPKVSNIKSIENSLNELSGIDITTNRSEFRDNIILNAVSGHLRYLIENLYYPKSQVSETIKSELTSLLNIINSNISTSGMYYIDNMLAKFLEIFKIYKDLDYKSDTYQSVVGKLSGLYRDLDPIIQNSEVFVKNTEDFSDIFSKRLNLVSEDSDTRKEIREERQKNLEENLKENLEILKEHDIPIGEHTVNIDSLSKNESFDEQNIDPDETMEESNIESDKFVEDEQAKKVKNDSAEGDYQKEVEMNFNENDETYDFSFNPDPQSNEDNTELEFSEGEKVEPEYDESINESDEDTIKVKVKDTNTSDSKDTISDEQIENNLEDNLKDLLNKLKAIK